MMENSMPKIIKAEHNEMNYHKGDIKVTGTIYADKSPCIVFTEPDSDEPIVKATSNITKEVGQYLPEDVVAIKNYSENAGVYQTLLNAEMISHMFTMPIYEHTELYVVRVLDKDILKDIKEALEYIDYLDNQRFG